MVVFDGRGREARARLEAGERPALALLEEPRLQPGPACCVVLLQAMPKGQRMDWIVEKATELGASVIVPMVTDRVVARPEGRQGRERVERWRRIAQEAARQCGVCWIPAVEEIQGYADALSRVGSADLFLLGSLEAGARPLRAVMAERRDRPPKRIGMIIGPEGDLTEEETRRAIGAGAIPVRLSSQVLRVETAALAGLATVMYEAERLAADRPAGRPEAGRT